MRSDVKRIYISKGLLAFLSAEQCFRRKICLLEPLYKWVAYARSNQYHQTIFYPPH